MDAPMVSILTVCRNAASTIESTIRSVLGQKGADFQYVVVDGASTDGTMEVVNRYRNKISIIVSEPDGGMYEALNKAIKLSSGRYVNLINADDRYASDEVLTRILPALERGSDVVYGNLIYEDGGKREAFVPPDKLNRKYLRHGCVTQQAIFYRREVFQKVGFFDESYKIVSDYQWLIRAYKNRSVSFEHVELPIAYFGIGGLTTGSATRARYHEERSRARREQFFRIEYLLDRAYRKACTIVGVKE